MQNSSPPDQKSKLSHFQQIDISLLRRQNQNLFQSVNQLRHRLAHLNQKLGPAALQIDREFVHRILKFLLTSFAVAKSAEASARGSLSTRKQAQIGRIISGVLEGGSSAEGDIQRQIDCFVRGSLQIINATVTTPNDENGASEVGSEGEPRSPKQAPTLEFRG